MKLLNFKYGLIVLTLTSFLSCGKHKESTTVIHAVTDLSHQFTFYADNRFYQQYMPEGKGVTNWVDLSDFDLSNTNLLILLGCDDRISYSKEDVETITGFLNEGGGVMIFGNDKTKSQNELLSNYGSRFVAPAAYPLVAGRSFNLDSIEGNGVSVIDLEKPSLWNMLIKDSKGKPVLVKRNVGKGTLLVSSRELAGSHPSARDSINKTLWKTILPRLAEGKKVDTTKRFRSKGIKQMKFNEDHGGFKMSYTSYMKPYAKEMVNVYKNALPFIEERMGVPLSPGMASHITLLPTGGGGFSSGETIGLAVWWGDFPEKKEGMIEFLTHESVHSWVLPFPEVWNEPIATYIGDLVLMDSGYQKEGLTRIENTIARATRIDPEMKNYDVHGNLTGTGSVLNDSEKNDIHWGKTFWIFEQLRKENPDIISDYFKAKRVHVKEGSVKEYDMNETVRLLSKAMDRDMFGWFNDIGVKVNSEKPEIK